MSFLRANSAAGKQLFTAGDTTVITHRSAPPYFAILVETGDSETLQIILLII